MDFKNLAQSVWDQFVTVWNTPVPFIAVAIALWFGMRWYFKSQHETRAANSDSTVKLLERQLQEYKDKTGTDTADAVKARIDALEGRIAEMTPQLAAVQPRKVSAEQRQRMAAILDVFRGESVEIASDAASADAPQLGKGLVAAFNASGWTVHTPMVLGVMGNLPTGIGIKVLDPDNLTPPQRAIVSAFQAAGIDFDFLQGAPRGLPSFLSHGSQRQPPVAEITLTSALRE
jgi:hypothetical protein